MMSRQILILLLITPVLTGCLFFGPKKQPAAVVLPGSPTGKIVNRDALIKDGTLAVLPFKAGQGAAADPQLDRISLMIAKGIIDFLNEEKVPFKILTTQDQGSPQMVIEGYIENLKRPGKISRWILRRSQTTLRVSGQMIVAGSKERVLIFQDTKSLKDPKRDGLDIAYQTGQDLGRFIADALNGG